MTTIAAVQGPTWSVVAFDSQVSEDSRKYSLPVGAGKCVAVGDYIFGIAGDFRAVNILAHTFQPPQALDRTGLDLDKFMTSKFIPALKKCFDDNWYGKDGEHGSLIMVSVNGTIYEIGSNYDCIRDTCGLYGMGSGGHFALGALHALDGEGRRTQKRAKEMLDAALAVAVTLDSGTSNPVTIIVQHRKG